MDNSLKAKFFRWIKIMIIIYCGVGIALYSLQDYFLFHPEALSRDYKYQFDAPFEEVDIAFSKTDTINLVKFFPKDSLRKGVVLYYHGNKENINRYAKYADNFTKHGYEVWMEDYPGFGKSVGERNEKKIYEEAKVVYELAASKYKADSIIIFGKSFGTGVSAYVASEKKCKRLILETPYYSIPALFASYAPIYPTTRMSKYRIPTYQYLKEVQVPITVFHGTNDGVIPYRNAARLKTVLKSSDEFITIEKGTHHNLNDFPLFHQKLDSLLNLR
ncbi:alpha/beta hydrolase [Ferruginibacter lapsinanis]|uniref:alpha/beta hydrolase n=1 Tax=Ferruginibacter lapsinanis TaxID=563172 RepID=UPI001E3638D6|nr:alpha/beta fold hydrolase [Ferruginibacter lapsinanis]UEG50287.1 alpha/beta hydrolase [Ferruginibacter lapsinanis]